MKKFMKALAAILTVATFATIPAMAETTTAENTMEEVKAAAAVENLFGSNIDEAGALLGLEKTQTQGEGEDEAYLTLYENADIMLGGRDGKVVDITLFNDSYEMYGVKIGMTVDEAKAALTAHGIAFTEGEIAELGIRTIEFAIPGFENAKGSFEINEDKISDAHLETAADTDEETAAAGETAVAEEAEEEEAEEEEAEEAAEEETTQTTSNTKATAPVKATGYIKLTGKAHLRKAADKESRSLKVMAKGTKLKYTATAKDDRGVTWYKVKTDGKTGWVSSKNTTKIKKSEYNTSKAAKPQVAYGFISLTGKANLRKKPDKDSKKLDTFIRGTVLEYTETAKDSRGVTWYKVTAGGHTGWISAKNARKC